MLKQRVSHKHAPHFYQNIRVSKFKGFTGIQTSKQCYHFFCNRTMICKTTLQCVWQIIQANYLQDVCIDLCYVSYPSDDKGWSLILKEQMLIKREQYQWWSLVGLVPFDTHFIHLTQHLKIKGDSDSLFLIPWC